MAKGKSNTNTCISDDDSLVAIRHIVLFSATDKNALRAIEAGLRILRDIPYSKSFEVARNYGVDTLSTEIDLVVYAEFETLQDLNLYKAHPLYQKSIEIVRPLRSMRIAVDF